MAILLVDGKEIKDPSAFTWGLQDISDSAAGRTQDILMHKNRIGQKRKISLVWNGPRPKEVSEILQAFNPEYVSVTYPDAMSGKNETRTFYVGDRTAPMKTWTINNKLYTQVAFEIIER
ncbi:MAG: hypothetical protein J6A75_01625 [Lachnospiraceae bacterium]|nr:hypothetical protein [Lachnospiraceae bacterium]